jgi:hypothetical protein
MCRIEGWSVRTLSERIDPMLYERTARGLLRAAAHAGGACGGEPGRLDPGGALMATRNYHATGPEVEFEPGSHGRVLRDLFGNNPV